jgi:hypothetical protein
MRFGLINKKLCGLCVFAVPNSKSDRPFFGRPQS